MPNWCSCDLTISGPKADVNRFITTAGGDSKGEPRVLDEEPFLPYPQRFKDQDAKSRAVADQREAKIAELITSGMDKMAARQSAIERYPFVHDGFNSGGYEWCATNWGTKWGFCDPVREEVTLITSHGKKAKVIYHFETAWSPPVPLIETMSKQFPTITFMLRYFEAGMGFTGTIKLKNTRKLHESFSDTYRGRRGG